MKIGFSSLLSKLSFRQQLAVTVATGIACLGIASSIGITKVTQNIIYQKLLEEGKALTQSFAIQSTLSLLYQSQDSAIEAAQATLSFPDVTGIAILTPEKNLLYAQGQDVAAVRAFISQDETVSFIEDDLAWYFSSPVFAGNQENSSPFLEHEPKRELVGFVQVAISKESLLLLNQKIFNTNLVIAAGLAALILLFLMFITNLVSNPLNQLVERMRLAQQGKTGVRTPIRGPKDIRYMGTAFNNMMEELEFRQQQLELARDSALAAAKIKGEFATTVSHELRTPMNGVMGMLELLSTLDLDAEQMEYVDVARASSESLLQLIDDVLDFSHIESGKLKLHNSKFYPREMLRGIIELLTPQASQKQLTLTGEVDPTLPQVIVGDSSRIRQVLINLVGNAIKFTQKGGIRVQITQIFQVKENDTGEAGRIVSDKNSSTEALENSTLSITVTDTGIGIATQAQRLIFDAFSQVDSSTTREFGGTGLGLAISKQLVNLMGGNIGVRSRPDEGSTFWFTIPVTLCNDQAVDDHSLSILAGTRVLLVSNMTKRCHVFLQTLKLLECFFRHATSPTEARNILRNASTQGKAFALVILDLDNDNGSELSLLNSINHDPTIEPIKALLLSKGDYETLPKNAGYFSGEITIEKVKQKLLKLFVAHTYNAPEQDTSKPEDHSKISHTSKILVAEDNQANQIVIGSLLKKLGYQYDVVENGNRVLVSLESEPYGLVLMDCNMPVMNGFTASQMIRRKESSYRDIPIIALTANLNPSDFSRCYASGMNDCISKPIKLEVLRRKILDWLDNSVNANAPQPSSPGSHQSGDSNELEAALTGESTAVPSGPLVTTGPEKINTSEGSSFQQNVYSQARGDIESIHNTTLLSLKTQLGSTFSTLISSYLEDTPEHLNQLGKSIEIADWNQIKCIAHVVKGSSANVGAKKLLYQCQEMEDLCEDQQINEVRSLAKEIQLEFTAVERILKGLDKSLPLHSVSLHRQAKILIVDDDPNSCVLLQGILERDGYEIELAANGVEAVKACEESVPDLILMDAMMPIMDGITACQRITASNIDPKPSILIITEVMDESIIEQAFAAGATDFIYKPINMTVLRQRVSRLLHTGNVDRHIRHLSYYDSLTSLPNRTLFLERSREIIASAAEKVHKVAILFMDLDRFKLINDTQGHEAGDLLLKTFSQRLESCVRNADLVARLGGDEFAVVLNKISSQEAAKKVAGKIIESLSGPFIFMQQQLHISTSIGIAVYPENGSNIEELMKHADTAMFAAKANGGKCYEHYHDGMEKEIARQIELESEIQQALENDEFVLHYQPQVDLRTNEITGCEALIRWQHPKRGLLSPIDFIPFAEKVGFINAIGTWVLNRACRQLREWLDNDPDSVVPIAVNISGRELSDDVVLQRVEQALEQTKIPPSLLKLEITEDTLVGSDEDTTKRLYDLRDLGIMLAIDDFGIGYSSLSYLKIFPIDTLKIDRSFVRDIPDKANSDAIISGIIALGHSLNLKVIAEGIETEQQRDFLREKGCDIMQGYFLSKPLPVEEFEEWVDSHNKLREFILTQRGSSNSTQPPLGK